MLQGSGQHMTPRDAWLKEWPECRHYKKEIEAQRS